MMMISIQVFKTLNEIVNGNERGFFFSLMNLNLRFFFHLESSFQEKLMYLMSKSNTVHGGKEDNLFLFFYLSLIKNILQLKNCSNLK